jgi:NAD(P)-dependent dehydrogenase (short-subunit alcohol dehydrogenase family)
LKYQFNFNNKVICVTGSGRGIGQETAVAFGSLGAHVILISRTESQLRETAQKIEEVGGKATVIAADMSCVDNINKMVAEIKKSFQRLDILVNNHAVNIKKDSIDVTEEEWDLILDTNLKSYFFLSTAVAREFMIPQGGGNIVNTASLAGIGANIRATAYSASKAGVVMITKALACEWAKYNIRVNAIAPGYIRTQLNEKTLSDPNFAKQVLARTPVGRFGETCEAASAILFLASDLVGYMTGQTLIIDGGKLCYSS